MTKANPIRPAEGRDRPTGGIAFALRALASPLKLPTLPPTHADVVYKRTRAGRRPIELKFDAHIPTGPGPHAAYVLVHGGGFVIGSRRMKPMRYMTTRLPQEGVAAFAVDYRLLQRGGVLPRPVRDVQDALAFIRERAGEYGVDPERLFLGGFSAGGALALLAAGMPHREGGPPNVRGVASVFPPTDFSRLRGGTATTLRHLLTRARTAEGMRARSPVAHADFEAPVRVIHGDADEMVPIAHSERFVAERKRLGREAELLVYEGAPHTFNCLEDTEYPERCVRDLVAFVRAHAP